MSREFQYHTDIRRIQSMTRPQVPGRVLHTSLRHCQPITSALFQSISPDSTTSPAQYSQSSGILYRTHYRDLALSRECFRQILKTNLFRHYHWVHTAQYRCFMTLRYINSWLTLTMALADRRPLVVTVWHVSQWLEMHCVQWCTPTICSAVMVNLMRNIVFHISCHSVLCRLLRADLRHVF